MKTLSLAALLLFSTFVAHAQDQSFKVKRVKSHSESVKFGPAGTVSLIGAPVGSVTVRGWAKNEVRVDAEVTVYAESEEDAARISNVTGFAFEESITSLRIHSFGTHDKKAVKKIDRKFPKKLRQNPFKLDYVVYVPHQTDLRLDGGTGKLDIAGVEGVFIINYFSSEATLNLIGGRINVTIGSGSLDVTIPTQSWRGRSADIRITNGDLILHLPTGFNADISANVLRKGRVIRDYDGLVPQRRTKFTDKAISARSGSGGATLNFVVGDGDLRIQRLTKPEK